MKNYDVSLVMPVYNVENYIRESLNSALNQTFDSIEFIIIDDCGTDDSMRVAESIIESHQREKDIRIVRHSENKGLSEARNTGIREASGKYIFFLDSDDEITPTCIELHYNQIVKYNADFTVANITMQGSRSIYSRTQQFETKDGIGVLRSFLCKEWMTSAWNKLYKRSFLLKNNMQFIPGMLHEDAVWCFDLARRAQKIAHINDSTYTYKIRNNSITSSKANKKRIEDAFRVIKIIYGKKDYMPECIITDYNNYIDSLKLILSVMLLNSTLSKEAQKLQYGMLKEIKTPLSLSVQSYLLHLNFSAFKLIVRIPYFLYKRFQ